MAYVTVWKIGPACAAQQAKKVSARTMNGADTNASLRLICGPSLAPSCDPLGIAGGLRTNSASGTSVAHTTTARTTCAARQSICVMSQAAKGDIVIGATPPQTDTRDTARPRCSVIHPLTAAIIGEKKLPTATPTTSPNA